MFIYNQSYDGPKSKVALFATVVICRLLRQLCHLFPHHITIQQYRITIPTKGGGGVWGRREERREGREGRGGGGGEGGDGEGRREGRMEGRGEGGRGRVVWGMSPAK